MSDETLTPETATPEEAAPAQEQASPLASLSPEQVSAIQAIINGGAPSADRSSDSVAAQAAAPVAAETPAAPDPRDAQIAELQQQLADTKQKLADQNTLLSDFEALKANVGHVLSKVQPIKDVITFLESL